MPSEPTESGLVLLKGWRDSLCTEPQETVIDAWRFDSAESCSIVDRTSLDESQVEELEEFARDTFRSRDYHSFPTRTGSKIRYRDGSRDAVLYLDEVPQSVSERVGRARRAIGNGALPDATSGVDVAVARAQDNVRRLRAELDELHGIVGGIQCAMDASRREISDLTSAAIELAGIMTSVRREAERAYDLR